MRKQLLRDHFGSFVAAAKALGVSKAAVSNWPDDRIPEGIAYKVESLTGGALRVDPADYPRARAPEKVA